jgi:hypothetical protein
VFRQSALCTLAVLFGVACGGPSESSPTSDAAANSSFDVVAAPSDAAPDVDASLIVCAGPLPYAGFSSLADLPVAQLCAQSADASDSPGGLVFESPTPCDGLIWVSSATGIDCSAFWLFDASTGALQAAGSTCNAEFIGCSSVPGFMFPNQCFPLHGTWPGALKSLCPDASD